MAPWPAAGQLPVYQGNGRITTGRVASGAGQGYDWGGCSNQGKRTGGLASTTYQGVTVKEVMKFFGYTSAAHFAVDWKKLTTEDKLQLTEGVKNGSLTY